MKNPLVDQEFLRKLDLQRNKATYAKIILLTFDEEPVEEIQGRITQGSINIDGKSAVRRTCSLTMMSDKVDINNTYWALKNKFKLEVGVENTVDSQYPDVIWFKQGTYVFTSLNMNVQSNNFTISINGKDKMCLLNGEVGGMINASTDFGKLEEYTYMGTEIVRNVIEIPIVDIIKNAVHVYGGQPLSTIVLNDIDDYGLELLEYRCDSPMYMPRSVKTGEVMNMTMDGKQEYWIYDDSEEGNAKKISLEKILNFYDRTQQSAQSPSVVYTSKEDASAQTEDKRYNIIKIEYGETAGYRTTELTYPGELVANVGESLVTVLDKIKNMFSDFEYFFDVDGRFIFQKKKTYINTSFNNLTEDDDEIYAEDAAYTSSAVYSFENGTLLTAFTNTPQILNIKNDYSIWGKRKGVGGADIPIHLRYAIGIKPTRYKALRFKYEAMQITNSKDYKPGKYYLKKDDEYILAQGNYIAAETYYQETDEQVDEDVVYDVSEYDWRELIYQMALDYFKYNHKKDNFTQLVAENNPDDYPTGITGYEAFYTDLQAFWRQIYNPDALSIEEKDPNSIKYKSIGLVLESDYNLNNGSENYYIVNPNYKAESTNDNEKYRYIKSKTYDSKAVYYIRTEYVELDVVKGVSKDAFSTITGFCQGIVESPETLNFWFDFMSVEGDMAKYSIQTIGNRPKAVNNDKVTAIYFQEMPTVLFINKAEETEDSASETIDYTGLSGYTYIQLTDTMENYFSISAQGKSAMDELDSLLYQHTNAAEAVTLTTVPIYHLQPNTRIFVKDDNTGINGEYIVSKITIPLQYNGTTSITTTKAVDRIY